MFILGRSIRGRSHATPVAAVLTITLVTLLCWGFRLMWDSCFEIKQPTGYASESGIIKNLLAVLNSVMSMILMKLMFFCALS